MLLNAKVAKAAKDEMAKTVDSAAPALLKNRDFSYVRSDMSVARATTPNPHLTRKCYPGLAGTGDSLAELFLYH